MEAPHKRPCSDNTTRKDMLNFFDKFSMQETYAAPFAPNKIENVFNHFEQDVTCVNTCLEK